MKVLFLTAWYPHNSDKMSGLFVRKHAEAVSLFCEVCVLYIHHSPENKDYQIVVDKKNNLTEIIIYFPCKKDILFYKFRKVINYLIAYKKGFDLIRKNGFKPDIIHANVLTRTGVIAFLKKIINKTPYIVTEHWTRYLPEHNKFDGILHKFITRIVVRNASAILPVSQMLQRAMINHKLLNNNYIVVDNVIDPAFLHTYPTQFRVKKRIILVSCFDEPAKNVKGIIRVINNLSKIRTDFELEVIGNGADYNEIVSMTDNMGLTNQFVFFRGEKTSNEVAEAIFNSDFMIIFSNYETAGIVITESLALGKPVLSTRVGIAPDFIDEQTGIIIEIGDETAFLNKLNYMLDNISSFDNSYIMNRFKNRFTYESVGKKITTIYESIFNKAN